MGSALGAEAIVSGRISIHERAVQIGVDLVQAKNNAEIWGGHYSRPASDLLASRRRWPSPSPRSCA